MSIKVRIRFTGVDDTMDRKLGDYRHTVTVTGNEVQYDKLTIGDVTSRIEETEAHLKRITGLEVKIETASE